MTTPHESAAAAVPGFIEKAPLERYVRPSRPSLVGMSRAELGAALGEIGVPPGQRKMRAQQLWHWLYVRGATGFDIMTSVSKELRAALARSFTLDRPEVVAEQVSVDGTRKWLLRLPGETNERPHEVECVYIPETGRGTLCVSSQVGCTLACTFCHTGTQRLVRNLTASEIVGQVLVARDRLGDWPGHAPPAGAIVPHDGGRFVTNIVMMGALLEEVECLSSETAMRVIETKIKRVDLLETNRKALTTGQNFIDNQVRVGAVSQPDGFAY